MVKNRLIAYLGLIVCLITGIQATAQSNICDIIYPEVVIYHDSTNYDSNARIFAVKLRNLIGHFKADVTIKDISDYSAGDMDSYDTTFYLGTAFDVDLPAAFYSDVANSTNSVVWFNYNIWKLLNSTNDTDWIGIEYNYEKKHFDRVLYKDEELFRNNGSSAIVLETNGTPIVHAYMKFSTNDTDAPVPYALQTSNFWYFADNPLSGSRMGGRSLVLADLLHDILGSNVSTGGVRRALLRLEDYKISQWQIADMNVVVSNLAALNVPAAYAVIPRTVDPGNSIDITISESADFRESLQNIRRNNGELLSHGYTHQHGNQVSADGWEFWDDDLDAPMTNDSWSWAKGRLDAARDQFMGAGMPVKVWETPHYRGSVLDYNVMADCFRRLFEQVYYSGKDLAGMNHSQLQTYSDSNPTMSGQRLPYMIVQNYYGSTVVVPENLDYISPGKYDSNGLEKNVSNKVVYAEKMKVVRDGVAACFYHPFLGGTILTNLVQSIRGAGYTYVPVSDIYREFPVELESNTNQVPVNNSYRHITATTEIRGDMVIGKYGSDNYADITTGAVVTCKNAFAGMKLNAATNVLIISVSNAVLNCGGVVAAGLYGDGNKIIVTNGGAIYTEEGALGYFAAASNNEAVISGVGSVWSNHFGFYVGPETFGNCLSIKASGKLQAQFGEIGGSTNAGMNMAVVDGGSWTNSDYLTVGVKGSDNELLITNGGCVAAGYLYLGSYETSTNNRVTVAGSNSCINVNDKLIVGCDGGWNKFTVDGGAAVAAANCILGMYDYSLSNKVMISDGSLNISNTIDIRRGELVLSNGVADAKLLLVGDGATVQIYEGFDFDNVDVITNAGTIVLHGEVNILGELHLVGNGVVEHISKIRDIIYPQVAIYLNSTNSGGMNVLYGSLLRNMIGHFKAETTFLNVYDYSAGDMNNYQAIFYIGTDFNAGLPDAFLADSINTERTFVWMKYSIWELMWSTNDTSRLGFDYVPGDSKYAFDQVEYKGQELFKHADYHDSYIATNNSTPIVHAWMQSSTNAAVDPSPYAIQSSNFWYIADNPMSYDRQGGRILVLADLLHDILGSGITTNNYRGLIRLEDVNALSTSATDVNNISSALAAMDISGTFGVIPRAVNPGQGEDLTISENPDILAAVLNIRRNNSEILTHGYTHQNGTQVTAVAWEFWDHDADAPLAGDSWDWAAGRLDAAKNEFMKAALPATIWETPHYEGSFVDCNVFADKYNAIYERLRYAAYETDGLTHSELESISSSNPTLAAQMVPYKVVQHSYGKYGTVIPENIDYISPGSYDYNGLEQNISNKLVYTKKVEVVRDAVVSGYYHTYFGVDTLTNMLQQIKALDVNYVPVRTIIREFPLELNVDTNSTVVNNYPRTINTSETIAGDLVNGKYGSGNELQIISNSTVDCKNVFIGMKEDAISNNATVADAAINCDGVVAVGLNGYKNSMLVTNGGAIYTTEGALGYFTAASNNEAVISGAGSVWSNHFGFYVGPDSSGNRLAIENGGTLLSLFGELGGIAGADNNRAKISGNDSIWSNREHFVVGAKGNDNELMITNGGCLYAAYAYIGLNYFATNNSITVSGSNSCLQVDNTLTIGADGPQSKLFVYDGGAVTADELVVGMYDRAISNTVKISGNGSLNISNTINVLRGDMIFSNGTANAHILSVGEDSTIQIYEGFDFSGIDIITNAGTIILHGDITIPGNLYVVSNGVVITDENIMKLGGDYIELSAAGAPMTNRVLQFSADAQHTLQTASQDAGGNLAGFTANSAFNSIGVYGTVDVVNVIYVWSLSGSGTLNLPTGSRFYYVDSSDWSGAVNLTGDAVFEKIDIELSDISVNSASNGIVLSWPTGSGLYFRVEWTDNLVTGGFTQATSLRALSNSVHWTDTGAVDRLPPVQVPLRFYRLQANP